MKDLLELLELLVLLEQHMLLLDRLVLQEAQEVLVHLEVLALQDPQDLLDRLD